MCVLNDRNLGDVEELIRFAAAYDASFMIQPYAAFKSGKSEFVPQCESVPELLRLKKRYRNFVSNRHFLSRFERFYGRGGVPQCRAGRAFFNVDNFMNVQKCVEFREEKVGNLRELDAVEMLRRLNTEQERNQCRACWYNCRGEVESLYSVSGFLGAAPTLLR